jgi:ribonuclease D
MLAFLLRQETIALDTEADSRHHYRERLSLIQLSAAGRCWIVDPLAGLDLGPLLECLAQRQLLIHGADYDLRLLHRTFGFVPARVFDTVLAAQLLGWTQFGLTHVVFAICNHTLDKGAQQSDWSRRPLKPELLAYAADDTRYLFEVARELERQLIQEGRLDWHRQACERQIQAARNHQPRNEEEAWRIKGGKHLAGRAGAVLRELWRWRDALAQRADRPPFKIANNEFLLGWAKWVAENPKGTFEELPERPAWLRGPRQESFERALKRGLELPPDQWPAPPERSGPGRLTKTQEETLGRLIQARDTVAAQLKLDAAVLAPREALKTLARVNPGTPETFIEHSPLLPWQTECLLEPALAALTQPDE